MRIGISASAYCKDRLDEAGLKRAKAHGYDCLDYGFLSETETPYYALNTADFEKHYTEERRMAEDAGISIYQTHGPWRWPPKDTESADRKERFEKMCMALTATKLLGAQYMVIHPIMPFGDHANPDPKRFHEMNVEFFAALTKVARQEGVGISFENMPMPVLTLARPSEMLAFAREIDSEYFTVCLDTGHAAICGESPAQGVRLLGKMLTVLHVHDNDGHRDQHLMPYEGSIDWEDFRKALKETDFSGVLSLETKVAPLSRPDWLLDRQQKTLADIAGYLASNR